MVLVGLSIASILLALVFMGCSVYLLVNMTDWITYEIKGLPELFHHQSSNNTMILSFDPNALKHALKLSMVLDISIIF